MLTKLIIRNYLLLKDIEINLADGFNVLTGETGAGKSILINALSLLLGNRIDYSLITKGKDKMIVECFIKPTLRNKNLIDIFLNKVGIEKLSNETLIVRREIYNKGYTRNFVNDCTVALTDLRELGDIIIDIHSQNEHQSLLKRETHIKLLDEFIHNEIDVNYRAYLNGYIDDYNKLIEQQKKYHTLINQKKELEDRKSYLEFQLNEINAVRPLENEDIELEKELKILENIETIRNSLTNAYKFLYEGTGSAVEKLSISLSEIEKIQKYDEEVLQLTKDIKESLILINESSQQIRNKIEKMVYDEKRIETIRERLYKIQYIKKKYGRSIEEIIKLKSRVEVDLTLLENIDDRIKEVEIGIESLKNELFKRAKSISKIRISNSKLLEKNIISVFKEVGLENAELRINFGILANDSAKENCVKYKDKYLKLSVNGIDDVEFFIKVNKGDDFTPLRKTASMGEISRIMLSIKAVLTSADSVSTLVFDEIDTGISGRVANKVGKVLEKLSETHQIISITHLAQIAALADEHFLVEKEIDEDKTITKIRKLNKEEKLMEVAKLLSGEKITDSAIKSAKELIKA